jgi:SAM-dependent methyltransferase
VRSGWRCLEVGAGGGSIARWLCDAVGASGRVVATDVETRFLEAIGAPNLEIRRHDVVSDPLESGSFDLVHSRAVLDHLPERDAVVRRLVDALAPGGWLVLEGGDFSTVRAVEPSTTEEGAFFDSAFAAVIDAARATGFDPTYGRRLGAVLRGAGLESVTLEGAVFEWNGEHPLAQLYSMTFQRLRPMALERGVLSERELERLLLLMASPSFAATSNTLFLARGRKGRAPA